MILEHASVVIRADEGEKDSACTPDAFPEHISFWYGGIFVTAQLREIPWG